MSRVQLLRILMRNQPCKITAPFRTKSCSCGIAEEKSSVDANEINALKDFVDDAIVRGSSLEADRKDKHDVDNADIHQRHFLRFNDLRKKELMQALSIYDQCEGIDDFVHRYRLSPTFSVAGVIGSPYELYYKVIDVKELMALGMSPMQSLRALQTLHTKTIHKQMPILMEMTGSDQCVFDKIGRNMYGTVNKRSLQYVKKKKLFAEKDIIRTLVDQLPISEELKTTLIHESRKSCGSNVDALSASEVKLVILNEYLKMVFPNQKFNPVTDDEFGKLMYFRLQDAVRIVDIIQSDSECMKNLARIHFGSLSGRLTPSQLQRLLHQMPTMGQSHISEHFFHKNVQSVFTWGVDRFIERITFLRDQGFSDVEILSRPTILQMRDTTRDSRLRYWYSALGKNNVVLSNMGIDLIQTHRKASYRYEITNGKKSVPVHMVLRSGCNKSTRCHNVIIGYMHEFCNKLSLDAETFIRNLLKSTHFKNEDFDLANMYNVSQFLQENNITGEQLQNSPYILITELEKVKDVFAHLSSTGELDEMIRHPLFLDMIVYLCNSKATAAVSAVVGESDDNKSKEFLKSDAVTSSEGNSSLKVTIHDDGDADEDHSIMYDGDSPPLPSPLMNRL